MVGDIRRAVSFFRLRILVGEHDLLSLLDEKEFNRVLYENDSLARGGEALEKQALAPRIKDRKKAH